MKFENTEILGCKILTPNIFYDKRGCFFELWNDCVWVGNGVDYIFVQDNISTSTIGSLRGMHTQLKYPQAKIVCCLKGAIYDVVVDCRPNSPTFGKWYGRNLNQDNHNMLLIPQGVAHGYYALSDATILMKVTTHYTPGDEIGFKWDDEKIGIKWPLTDTSEPILAEKDKNWRSFDEMMEVLAKSR